MKLITKQIFIDISYKEMYLKCKKSVNVFFPAKGRIVFEKPT